MDWLWNWGGECFGYREGDSLFTYFGKEIGRFDGEEIFGNNGRYLGEVMSDNRLITSRSKKSWVRGSFGPRRSGSYARYANFASCWSAHRTSLDFARAPKRENHREALRTVGALATRTTGSGFG
jgi:hypothetical protein